MLVSPVEYINYGEANAYDTHKASYNEARAIYPKCTNVEVDLVFGEYAGAINHILYHIVNEKSLKFKPNNAGGNVSPIHSIDLGEVVSSLIKDKILGE